MNYVNSFKKALIWIEKNTVKEKGIKTASNLPLPYPEVSGYFIPSLLKWNEIERAYQYGNWLLEIQHKDGYWMDPKHEYPHLFDTGQILKGLLALYDFDNDNKWLLSAQKASSWMMSCVQSNGFVDAPDIKNWGGVVPLAVVLYAYQPVKDIAKMTNNKNWLNLIDSMISFFKNQKGITDFSSLSHFHAYIIEAFIDLGEFDIARDGMKKIEYLQRKNGSVSAYIDKKWVCSTGLFQYAVIWYKLGEHKKADKAFDYAVKLQNTTGGWYGSYGFPYNYLSLFGRFFKNLQMYFPRSEISWTVKYFLDAFDLKLKSNFEDMSIIFKDYIDYDDGRLKLLIDSIDNCNPKNILDVGCGKGRYLYKLLELNNNQDLHAVDISEKVMSQLPETINKKVGTMMSLPFNDEEFDFVYTIEALEHSVNLSGALNELTRILKKGGTLLIIDKNKSKLGRLKMPKWEQWFSSKDLKLDLEKLGYSVKVIENVPYEGKSDGLFIAWIATKEKYKSV